MDSVLSECPHLTHTPSPIFISLSLSLSLSVVSACGVEKPFPRE